LRGTGIGPALRKARLLRAKSIEEASRETRIRPEYLRALEHEDYDQLLGDVYIRGFLRSYSTYLGLDADRVLTVYNHHFGPPRPTLPRPRPGPSRSRRSLHPLVPQTRRHHFSWPFLILVAVLAMAVLGAAGLLTRSGPKAGEPAAAPSMAVLPPSVVVALLAYDNARVSIRTDGKIEFDGTMKKGQGLSFEGTRRIGVRLAKGGLVQLTVNGHPLGNPGSVTEPWSATFGPQDFRGVGPTPVPGPSGSVASPGLGASPGPGSSPSPSSYLGGSPSGSSPSP
jgi:Helix-turn-helix domain/Domain of unknown function (DUF4115)